MLNPERVDWVKKDINSEVEIEFTMDDANRAFTIVLTQHDAMKLSHMIQDECSLAAQRKKDTR
jgi:hypothetical protein